MNPHRNHLVATVLLAGALLYTQHSAAAAQPATGVTLSDTQQRLAERSRGAMRGHAGLRGLDRHGEPQVLRAFRDSRGEAHVHWQSTVDGVPVWGGDFIAHLDARDALESVTPARVPALRRGRPEAVTEGDGTAQLANAAARPGTLPLLDAPTAMALAEAEVGCADCYTAPARADLWMLVVDDSPRLGWRVRLSRLDGTDDSGMPVIFVDAQDGFILGRYDDFQTGTAKTAYNGIISFDTSRRLKGQRSYYLEDLTRRVGVTDAKNTSLFGERFVDGDDVWSATRQIAGADVLWAMQRYLDYLFETFGRAGLDGNFGPGSMSASVNSNVSLLRASVHYQQNYNNAGWVNESYAVFGDGDGVLFSPLVTLDLVAHELSHGLTDFTADLIYSGESGALNESVSDVFAALAERAVRGESANVWLIGEQCYTPATPGDAMRSMAQPHLVATSYFTGDDYPDHYSERYQGIHDYGGVHVNSSIANHAFYLLAQGGTHHLGGSMTGIGADEAAQIWYHALNTQLTSTSNFHDARAATITSAVRLYGRGTQSAAVATAWSLVGVEGDAPPPTPIPDDGLIVNGGFEGTADPWVLSGWIQHYPDGPYPHSGKGLIGGPDYPGDGSATQAIFIPPGARSAELTFWLAVQSPATAVENRLRVEVLAKNGAVLATLAEFDDLDNTNGQYVHRRGMSLLPWRGVNIRLRFRLEKIATRTVFTSFLIDDVAVR